MGSTSKPDIPSPPKSPKPTHEWYYENGRLRSSRTFSKARNGYFNRVFNTPVERQIQEDATNYMGKLMKDLPSAINPSPEKIDEYGDAYEAPQIAALDNSYNRARGQLEMAGADAGMKNSVGFQKYGIGEIEKNRAQGLADIAANRKMVELDLPNQLLTPYLNQFNLFNAAMQGQQANLAQDLEPSFQGSQAGTNALNQQFQNQMARWQAQQQPRSGGGGLFSFFTGGA